MAPEKNDTPTWHARIELTPDDGFSLANDIVWPPDLSGRLQHTLYENPESGQVVLEIYAEEKPEGQVLEQIIETLSSNLGCLIPALEFLELEEQDWVEISLQDMTVVEAGRFIVHGSHRQEEFPEDKIPIMIDAALAFGTGHHETTRGCLLALDHLADKISPASALDLGCGSGILAFAMQKLWPNCRVIGAEKDGDAVTIAKANAQKNNVPGITMIWAEGFDHPDLRTQTFDLIAANILSMPLIDLAPEVARHLAPSGILILSGILENQEKQVLDAYQKDGFVLKNKFTENDWPTLVLGRD